jgi:hypothetical protein
MSNLDLNKTYTDICGQAKSKRALDVLGLINTICTAELKGDKNFSVSNIGSQSQEEGGPSTQAIRNSGGKLYRDLIDAYKASVTVKHHKKIQSGNEWVDNITHTSSRYAVFALLEEVEAMKVEVNTLKKAARERTTLIVTSGAGRDSQGHQERLTAQEVASLKESIDPAYLADKGLYISDRGALEDAAGNRLLSNSFADAIRKALKGV